MTCIQQNVPECVTLEPVPRRAHAKQIVFVALPGVQMIDIAGPADVFDTAQRVRSLAGHADGYTVTVVGPKRTITTSNGIGLTCARFAEAPARIDTLIVAGAIEFAGRRWSARELDPLRPLIRRSRRVASVCAGAFVLQALGVLANKRATTHWLCLEALRRCDPPVEVERDAIYVQDGNVFTSAGASSGIDLALALVAQDLGHDVAVSVARLLVVYLHRPGGQSQFSAATTRRRPHRDPILRVQSEVVDAPGADHRVVDLARRAGMSPRNFSRVFTDQTGVPPARFVRDVRVEAARQRLEMGSEDLDAVANEVGLGTAETLRRAFRAKLGVAPSAYRQRFRH